MSVPTPWGGPPSDLPVAGPVRPSRADHFGAAMAGLTRRLGGRPAFGGDYNPEQWPEPVWAHDVVLMREAGVNLVSVGIFSWALLEPKAGHYEFGWLDRVLDLLHRNDIAVDLANASASPPPWFSREYPESLPVDVDGTRRSPGARQTFCPSSPDYRRATAALTRQLVDRYADHPAVVLWHVHNEYGCHNWSCYCDTSAAAFRRWLQARYADLDALNDAWATAFWSQRYYDWDEILPPRRPSYHTFANPTQQLDFARFSSDELLDCFRAEAQILREHSTQPVTTNFMQFFKPVDYWRWAPEMDLISNDHYRWTELGEAGATHDLAMAADLTRSLADGAPWLLMEHSTSAVNWQPRNPAKPAGQMTRDSLTHLARGADGALFFQWRASAAGAEKFHSGLVPHAGTDTRQWREVTELGARVAALAPVTGSRVTAQVAIVFDWSAWWGVELDSHPSIDVTMVAAVRRWHRALYALGITCDFVPPDGDLDHYPVVLLPSLYLCDDAAAERLSRIPERGGHLVVNYFSGIVDEHDHIRLGGYPGAFSAALGIRSQEFSPLPATDTVGLELTGDLGGGRVRATRWSELLDEPVGADVSVLARFTDGSYSGGPAVTRRRTAAGGAAWYLATEPDDATLDVLLRNVCQGAEVRPTLPIDPWPTGFDAVIRSRGDQSFLFAINSGQQPVPVPWVGTDLLTGQDWTAGQALDAGAVAVIDGIAVEPERR